MAATVISVTQLPKQSWEYGTNGQEQAFTNYYLVVLSNHIPTDPYAARVVLSGGIALGLPYANAYDPVSGFYAYKIKAENGDDPTGANWIVTAEFRSMPWVKYSGASPWNYYDVVERTPCKYKVPMTKDFSSAHAPIVNSAGDPRDEPLMMELINTKYRLHRHRLVSQFSYYQADLAQGTTNANSFQIIEVGNVTTTVLANCGMLHSIVAHSETWVDGELYYDIVAEIEIKGQYPPGLPDLTKVRLQNRGMRVLQTANSLASRVHATTTMDNLDNNVAPNVIGQPYKYPLDYPIVSLRGLTIVVPVTHPVFLNNPQGTQFTGADPSTQDLIFTRFPSTDWSSFLT